MNAFDEGFRREWFLQRDKIGQANWACYMACGTDLHSAWTNERGCYVGGSWMSPSKIAKAVAALDFDWSDDE